MRTVILFLLLVGGALTKTEAPVDCLQQVVDHAKWQATQDVTYDGSYYQIKYPGGDVPSNIGVCTDVIVRAYRSVGIDLQKLVHEDMLANKAIYDKRRYSKIVDSNIDHRRVPNLRTFFTRQGAKLPITDKGIDYKPGDIVFWDVAAGHVGMVVDIKVRGTDRYHVVHNIGSGPELEDFLFLATIVDHYRWLPDV